MTFRSYPFLALCLALGNAADRLGFVILKKGDAKLMLQTRHSVRNDLGRAADRVLAKSASVYVEVDRFAEIHDRVSRIKRTIGWWRQGKDYLSKTTGKCLQTQEMAKLRDWQIFCFPLTEA